MGLMKPIMAPIGVPLEYHRVTDIVILTNEQNVINVGSYINQLQREEELAGLLVEREKTFIGESGTENIVDTGFPADNVYNSPYVEGSTFLAPYDQYMTIESAYEYLKTLPEFEGAVDC